MLKENPNSVSRVEYDHRAREARLRLEGVERLLVKHYYTTVDFRPLRLLRLLGLSVSGNGHGDDQRTGSPSDRRPCSIPLPVSAAIGA